VRPARVEDQPGGHPAGAQGGEPLLGLTGRAALVRASVQDERGRADLIDAAGGGERRVPLRLVPGERADLVGRQEMAQIGGARHAREVADDPTGHRGGETAGPAGQVAGHEAAVAVPAHRQPGRVGDALGDQPVERLQEVPLVGLAPRPQAGGEEALAVPVAATHVECQHAPALGGEHLLVGVHRVGNRAPGVVRTAVHVQQQRPGQRRPRVPEQPAVHPAPVRDLELALRRSEKVDAGQGVVGQHPGDDLARGRAGPGLEDGDLAEAVGIGQQDGAAVGVARHRQAGDHPIGPAEQLPGRPAGQVERVEVRAAAVPGAEQHRLPVGGHLRPSTGICGAAGHEIAVQRGDQVDRGATVDRHAQQASMPDPHVPTAHDQQRVPFRGPGERPGHAVEVPGQPRCGPRLTQVEDVGRRLPGQVGVGGHRGGEGEPTAIRRPCRLAGVPVAPGQAARASAGHLDNEQVLAHGAQQPGPVGLVAEPVGHHRRTGPAPPGGLVLLFRGGQVHRRGEGEPCAVGAPYRRARAQGQLRQAPGLAATGWQQPHLCRAALVSAIRTGAQEGELPAVWRPRRFGIGGAAGELHGRAAVGAHQPQRRVVGVGIPVDRPQRVHDPTTVRRDRHLSGEPQVVDVLNGQTPSHRDPFQDFQDAGAETAVRVASRPPTWTLSIAPDASRTK
jgi:hypothetical protein